MSRQLYITQRAAERAGWDTIAKRTIKGAQPVIRPAMQREADRSLSRGFAVLIRLMDGALVPVERLA